MSTNVLVLEAHAELYRDRLQAEFPALRFTLARSAGELPRDVSDIDVLIAFGMELTDEFLAGARRLKWIQCLATGVDHLLRHRSLGRDVVLTSGRGIHGPPMRETVVYLMMGASRSVRRLVEDQKEHVWQRRFWSLLCGKTAAVVGVGIVGTAVAELLKAFGMRVIGVTRTERALAGFEEIMPTERLIEAARRADFLINVLPANSANALIFDGAVFTAMKPGAYYIGAGRGQTVNEAALIAALSNGRIVGAGLDVFATEPLPADSPLWDLPNVFLTPHLGGYVVEYEELVLPLIVENMRLFLAGRPREMTNIVAR